MGNQLTMRASPPRQAHWGERPDAGDSAALSSILKSGGASDIF